MHMTVANSIGIVWNFHDKKAEHKLFYRFPKFLLDNFKKRLKECYINLEKPCEKVTTDIEEIGWTSNLGQVNGRN